MAVQTVKALINGQEYILTYDSASGTYKSTITAPSVSSYNNNSEHYYPVKVTATDNAGNSVSVDDTHATLGASCKLRVKEKVAPVITVLYPTAGSTLTNSQPVIKWKVTDNDSGVDTSTISIKIDDGSAITSGITKSTISGGYECSYTPSALSDGSHTFYLNASDNDGNAATQVSSAFVVDTTPPALTVNTPADNSITNNASCVVSGSTNDALSTPVTLTINDTEVTVNADGSFTHTITLSEGLNTITVVATDAVGKSSTVVRRVTLDTGAPVISKIVLTPNPVDCGATYIISVTVTDE